MIVTTTVVISFMYFTSIDDSTKGLNWIHTGTGSALVHIHKIRNGKESVIEDDFTSVAGKNLYIDRDWKRDDIYYLYAFDEKRLPIGYIGPFVYRKSTTYMPIMTN